MKITQNGMACCSVVVGRDATWLEHHAAQELRSYIQKISGAVLLVVPEHDATRGRYITASAICCRHISA